MFIATCRCSLVAAPGPRALLGAVLVSSALCVPLAAQPAPGVAAAAAGAAPLAQQSAPAQPPPFPNRANEVMPAWLRLRGEFRERFEGVQGSGFVDGRDDTYWLSRVRLTATITPGPLVSFQVQAQDARVADKQVGPTGAPFKGTFDMRLAFADIGRAAGRVAVRVGRQELVYGDQRLVGHVGWLNTARTFDAAKLTLRGKRTRVDVFGASVVRSLERELDKSGNGNRFYGAYGVTSALIPKASVEPYLFVRSDRGIRSEGGALARLNAATIGARATGKLPARFDYDVDMALQRGALAGDRIEAWAGHWQLRQTLPGTWPVRLVGEFNIASGDRDQTDGTRGTFDQLYPTGHDKYGLADQVGWRNIRHMRLGLELPPVKTVQLTGGYHSWWLMELNDALYAASGVAIARVAGGAAASHVGQELDIQASRALSPQLQLTGGYAYMMPGRFLKQATPGASYSFPYVMVTYVFLADR
jgi:hypothetical protein